MKPTETPLKRTASSNAPENRGFPLEVWRFLLVETTIFGGVKGELLVLGSDEWVFPKIGVGPPNHPV